MSTRDRRTENASRCPDRPGRSRPPDARSDSRRRGSCRLAREGRAEITRVREIYLQADETPSGTFEDATKLRAVVGLVLVEPVRDAGEGRVRPRARRIGGAHAR